MLTAFFDASFNRYVTRKIYGVVWGMLLVAIPLATIGLAFWFYFDLVGDYPAGSFQPVLMLIPAVILVPAFSFWSFVEWPVNILWLSFTLQSTPCGSVSRVSSFPDTARGVMRRES